jgi:phytoene dehydrogenase-like protein
LGRLESDFESQLDRGASQFHDGRACVLESRIEYSDLATPLRYERYTGNTDGATSAWSWNPHNKFYKSPMKVHIDTPVKNLLIGSCWSVQIGGVPSAINAARLCARRIGS